MLKNLELPQPDSKVSNSLFEIVWEEFSLKGLNDFMQTFTGSGKSVKNHGFLNGRTGRNTEVDWHVTEVIKQTSLCYQFLELGPLEFKLPNIRTLLPQ